MEDYDSFESLALHFSRDVLSVDIYQNAMGWSHRSPILENYLVNFLQREGISTDHMRVPAIVALNDRLQITLLRLHALICYPTEPTEYPVMAKHLVEQVDFCLKNLNTIKTVRELSNIVIELGHTVEKLEITLSCLSAAHDYAKCFFGDVFKLEKVCTRKMLEVFSTCLTRVGLGNINILIASFSLAFYNPKDRETMSEVLKGKDMHYDLIYNEDSSSGMIFKIIHDLRVPIIRYVLYLLESEPNMGITWTDLETFDKMEFTLLRDESFIACASNCMDAYTKLNELVLSENGVGNTENVVLPNYVITEGLYSYTMRLNAIVNHIVQTRSSQSLIAMCEVEDVKKIASALGYDSFNIRTEAHIIELIRQFVSEVIGQDVSATSAIDLRTTVMDAIKNRDANIHTLNTQLGLMQNSCDDLTRQNEQKSSIIVQCVNKLNASIVNTASRANMRQLTEDGLEYAVAQACKDMEDLFNSNNKLRAEISRLYDRSEESPTSSHLKKKQLKKSEDTNKQLKRCKATAADQLRLMENKCAEQTKELSANIEALKQELAIANSTIKTMTEDIALKDGQIVLCRSQIEDAKKKVIIVEKDYSESKKTITSLISSNSETNTKFDQYIKDQTEINNTRDRAMTDLRDEMYGLQVKLAETEKTLDDLRTRYESASKKLKASEEQTRLYTEQIRIKAANNVAIGEENVELRDRIKTHVEQYKSICAELDEKTQELKIAQSELVGLKNEQRDMIAKCNEHSAQLDDISKRYEALQNTTKSDIENLHTQLTSAQSDLINRQAIHDNTVSQLNVQLKELESSNKLLKVESTNLKSTYDEKISTTSKDLTKLKEELARCKKQCADSNTSVEQFKKELQDAKRGYKESDSALKDLQRVNEELSDKIRTGTKNEDELKKQIREKNLILAKHVSDLKIANRSLERSRESLATTETELRESKKQLEDVVTKNEKNTKDLDARRQAALELESNFNQFKARAEELNTQLTAKMTVIQNERKKNESLTETLTKTKSELDALKNYHAELDHNLSTANENLTKLRTDIDGYIAQIAIKDRDAAEIESQLDQKDTEYQQAVSKLETTEKILEDYKENVSELETKLQENEQMLSTARDDIQKLNVELEALRQDTDEKSSLVLSSGELVRNYKQSVIDLRSELNTVSRDNNTLVTEKLQLQGNNADLNTQIQNLKKEIEDLKSERDTCNENIEKLQSERDACNENIGKLRLEIVTCNENIEKFRSERDACNENIEKLRSEKADCEKKNCEYKQTIERLTTENKKHTDMLEKERDERRIASETLQKKLDEIQNEYDKSQEYIDSLNSLNQEVSQRKSQLDQDHGALRTQLDGLQDQLRTSKRAHEETVAQLNATIEQQNTDIINLKGDIGKATDDIAALQGNLNNRNKAVEDGNTRIESLNDELQKSNTEKESIRVNLIKYEEECGRLTSVLGELQLQCENLNRTISEMKIEASRSKELNDENTKTIQELHARIAQQDGDIKNLETHSTEMLNNEKRERRIVSETLQKKLKDIQDIQDKYETSQRVIKELEQDASQREEAFSQDSGALQSQFTELQNQLRTLKEKHGETVAQLNCTIGQQDASIAELTDSIGKAADENRALQGHINNLNQRISEMARDASRSQELNDDNTKTIQESNARIMQQCETIKDLESRNVKMREDVVSFRTNIEQLKEKHKNDINALTDKNTVLEARAIGLAEQLKSSAENVRQFEIKNSQLIDELSSRDSSIAELNERLDANNTLSDKLKDELKRLGEECKLKLAQSSDSFTEHTEILSDTMGVVVQIFIDTYANACKIHGLICDLNNTILGANFSEISKIKPMIIEDFNYNNMQLTHNTVTDATNRMLDDVKRIAKKLNDSYKDTDCALNAVSVQCGFHRTPILTASRVIDWASKIFSAIRPHESSATNPYSDVDAYCKIVNDDIETYHVNIDKLHENVSSFHAKLETILKTIESIGS